MEEIEDILMEQKPDRRLLPNVPDPELQRTNSDRRGANADDIVDKVQKNIHENHSGVRFLVDYPVDVTLGSKMGSQKINGRAVDISSSGMLLRMPKDCDTKIEVGSKVGLEFEIKPGIISSARM